MDYRVIIKIITWILTEAVEIIIYLYWGITWIAKTLGDMVSQLPYPTNQKIAIAITASCLIYLWQRGYIWRLSNSLAKRLWPLPLRLQLATILVCWLLMTILFILASNWISLILTAAVLAFIHFWLWPKLKRQWEKAEERVSAHFQKLRRSNK